MSTTSRCMGFRSRTTRSWWRSWLRSSKWVAAILFCKNGDMFHVEHFVVVILYVLTYTYIAGIRNNVNGLRGARLVGCGLPLGRKRPPGPMPERLGYYRPIKKAVTLRPDADVLAWFKRQGRGYQTRINRALRKLMSEERKISTE